jgi:ABC-type sugar transport system ATPase subunit
VYRISVQGILQRQRQRALAREMVDSLGIKTPSLGVLTGTLSGGNQQKVVVAIG